MRRIAMLSAVLVAALGLATSSATAEKMGGQKYMAQMSGDQEVPKTGDPDGKGTAEVTIDSGAGQVCYQWTHSGIQDPDKAHIHRGAKGTAGGVVVNLDPKKLGQCVAADKAALEEIKSNPGGFYVNLHNAEYPDGAIRGQLHGGKGSGGEGSGGGSGGRGGGGGY
jgi:hypothetical protein